MMDEFYVKKITEEMITAPAIFAKISIGQKANAAATIITGKSQIDIGPSECLCTIVVNAYIPNSAKKPM